MTLAKHFVLNVAVLFAGCSNNSDRLSDSRPRIESGALDSSKDLRAEAGITASDRGAPALDAQEPPPTPKDGGKPPPPPKDGGKSPASDKGAKPLKDWGATDAGALAYQCLWNTKSEGECKDCCDCIGLACGDAAPCRDACPTHDFTKNTSFLSVTVKSTLGVNGDYSTCTAKGTQKLCKECCACGVSLACGDTKYCRDECNKLPDTP